MPKKKVTVTVNTAAPMKKRQNKMRKINKRGSGGMGTTMSVSSAPLRQTLNIQPYFKTDRSSRDGSLVISGCEYMGQFNSQVLVPTGDLLADLPIAPSSDAFSNGRLSNFASNYEKYVFTRLRLVVQSASAADVSGAYIAAFDRDISDPRPTGGESVIRQLAATQHSKTANVWQSAVVDVPLEDTQNFYYTNYIGGDPRLAYQGRFQVAAATPINSGCILSFYCEYVIKFMDPSLEDLSVGSVITGGTQMSLAKGKVYFPLSGVQQSSQSLPIVMAQPNFVTQNTANYQPVGAPAQGWSVPSGKYLVELDMNIQNPNSSFAATALYYLSAIANNNIVQPLVRQMNQRFVDAQQYVGYSTAQTGEIGYTSNLSASLVTNVAMKWLCSVPAGGAILCPLIAELASDNAASAIQNFSNKPPAYLITKVTDAVFNALSK